MATFMRLATRQTCQLFILRNARIKIYPNIARIQPALSISTSKKNKDAATISDTAPSTPAKESLGDKDENWISYGYDMYDRDSDEWQTHYITFAFCFALCWMCFAIAYYPDMRNTEWYQREAYLELARREKEGLPFIDKDLISADKIQLPTEEELEGVEIII